MLPQSHLVEPGMQLRAHFEEINVVQIIDSLTKGLYGVSPELEVPFGNSHHQAYNFLGSILGSPCLGTKGEYEL